MGVVKVDGAAALLVSGLLLVAARPPLPTAAPIVATAQPSIKAGVERWRAGDYPAAVAIWQPFAAAGDPDALFNLGQAYKLGRGVPQDAAVARDYYRKAATKGHLPAQANLGIALFQAGDKPESIRWLRTAADRGEARAQYVLGIAAFNGDGLPRSQALGYGYLLRAQASGLSQATSALGTIAPALSPTDRSAGEAVAASLAAGTGVPAALAAATAPRLITPPSAHSTALKPLPPASATGSTAAPSVAGRAQGLAVGATPRPTSASVQIAAATIPAPKPVRVPPAAASTAAAGVSPPVAPTSPPATRAAAVLTATPASTAPVRTAAVSSTPLPTPDPHVPATPPPATPLPAAAVPPPTPTAAAAPAPATITTTDVPAAKPVAVAAASSSLSPTPAARPQPGVALKPFETIDRPSAKKPSGWRVQLGAFSQRRLADAAWAVAKPDAGGAKPIFADEGAVIKLQVGPYATRDAAKSACAKLSDAGRACFITNG